MPGSAPRFPLRRVRGFVGVSGVYDVRELSDQFHARGLYYKLQDQIFSVKGLPDLRFFSPARIVAEPAFSAARRPEPQVRRRTPRPSGRPCAAPSPEPMCLSSTPHPSPSHTEAARPGLGGSERPGAAL